MTWCIIACGYLSAESEEYEVTCGAMAKKPRSIGFWLVGACGTARGTWGFRTIDTQHFPRLVDACDVACGFEVNENSFRVLFLNAEGRYIIPLWL